MPGRVTTCGENALTGYELPYKTDPYTQGQYVIDITHALIHEGKAFSHSGKVSALANGASYDHLISIPVSTVCHVYKMAITISAAPFDMFIYEGCAVSDNGSPHVSYNLIRDGAAPTVSISHQPAITDIGTLIDYFLITGSKQDGGTGINGTFEEWGLDSTKKYIIRMVNNSGGVADIGFRFNWYEL